MCEAESEFLLVAAGSDRAEDRCGGFQHRRLGRIDQQDDIDFGKPLRDP